MDGRAWCMAAPVLALLLAWRRRAVLPPRECDPSAVSGYLLLLVSVGLSLAVRPGPLAVLAFLAMWLQVAALVLLAWGWGSIRRQAAPLLVLLFAVPPPPFLDRMLDLPLRHASADLATRLLHLSGTPVFTRGNVLDMGSFQLHVQEVCSGLEFLYPILLIGLLAGYWFTRGFWKGLLVFLAAAPAAILSNGVRIALAGLLARHFSPDAAQAYFHQASSILTPVLAVGLLLLLCLLLGIPGRGGTSHRVTSGLGLVGGAFQKPLSLHIFCGALLLALAAVSAPHVLPRPKAPARLSFQSFPERLGSWRLTGDLLPPMTGLDAGEARAMRYENDQASNATLLLAWYPVQTDASAAHAPASFLVDQTGWGDPEGGVKTVTFAGNPATTVWERVLTRPGERLLVYSWYPPAGPCPDLRIVGQGLDRGRRLAARQDRRRFRPDRGRGPARRSGRGPVMARFPGRTGHGKPGALRARKKGRGDRGRRPMIRIPGRSA